MESRRLDSIDALRGFDMMFIMGMAAVIRAVCNLFPGGSDCAIQTALTHCEWDGLRLYDTIFPLFLFIAGISFPFSYSKQQAAGTSKGKVYWKIARRALILFAFGLIYNGLLKTWDWAGFRLFSVLGRIGVAWAIAAVIFINCKTSVRAVICGVILVGYWLLLALCPAPDAPAGEGPFSLSGNLVGYIDRVLYPDHLYTKGLFEPEGLLSNLPAVVTALLGMNAGEIVRREGISGNRKCLTMLILAAALTVVGLVWSNWFPINKKLWSSTFVLVVAGYSFAIFSLFYWIIDVKGWKGWIMPFKVIGMNSITIYMLQRIVNLRATRDFLFGGLAAQFTENGAALVNAAAYFIISWLILFFLYKKKIFLKI